MALCEKIPSLYPYAMAARQAYDFAHVDIPRTDTQAILFNHNKKKIIAFRGTTSLKDWKTNMNGGFVALRDQVLVREGFADAWISVRERVMNWVNGVQVHMTGHSLGGAIATVAAVDIAPSHDVTLVTFGAPRALHETCPLHHRIQAYRVVNNNDVVPRLPPESAGYAHRGRLVYFTERGEMMSHISPWEKLRDRIEGRIGDFGELGTDGIKDHDMDEYVRLCAKRYGIDG